MSVAAKQKENHIKVKQYITNARGHKVAAILDIKELSRVNDLIEDLLDLKVIEDRIAEPIEDYEIYSRKRKSRLNV
jgi:predicted transcriptional regulator